MELAGIVKSSWIDYPGNASTVIFLSGCNYRCGYCHNPEIVNARGGSISPKEFFSFLEKRRRFLDAVVISGGEPTIHKELYDLIVAIKKHGYRIKLDTNGSNPELLRDLLNEGLLDYVAMDVKGPFRMYREIAGAAADAALVRQSIQLLQEAHLGRLADSVMHCEFRTTICREILNEPQLREMLADVGPIDQKGAYAGKIPWYLQNYRDSGKRLDSESTYTAYEADELQQFGTAFNLKIR